MLMLSIKLTKQLGNVHEQLVLEVDLQLPEKKIISLTGPSGAGKTTILKLLAGLIEPMTGYISLGDQVWLDTQRKLNVVPQARKVGFVFQDSALFPNMTVEENLKFVLTNKKDSKELKDILQRMGITSLSSRYPHMLSGGEKQRVALARAVVRRPALLLLDEPFSSLDSIARYQLQEQLLEIHKAYDLTTLLVSHDPAEIYKLSDHIISIDKGQLQSSGNREDFFKPSSDTFLNSIVGDIVEITSLNNSTVLTVISGINVFKITPSVQEVWEVGNKVLIRFGALNGEVTMIA